MTLNRKDPIASHAYTLPVVREIPIQAGASSGYPSAFWRPTTGRLCGRRPRVVTTMLAPVTIAERTLRESAATDRPTSQRRLVALSLLRCGAER